MKYRFIILAAIFAVVGVWCFISQALSQRPAAVAPLIRFVAFTNATLGPKEPVLAIPTSRHTAALQSWFASGTNAAMFTITNPQNHTLLITAHGQLLSKQGNPNTEMAYLLQPPGFSEFFMSPHQEVTIKVAFPLQQGPWKLRLFFRGDSREHSISDVVRGIRRALGAPKPTPRSPIESEWVDQLP